MRIKEFLIMFRNPVFLCAITLMIVIIDNIPINNAIKTYISFVILIIGIPMIIISLLQSIRVFRIAMRYNLNMNEICDLYKTPGEIELEKEVLSSKKCDIIFMLYKKGWSIKEISETMNLCMGEVKLIIETSNMNDELKKMGYPDE